MQVRSSAALCLHRLLCGFGPFNTPRSDTYVLDPSFDPDAFVADLKAAKAPAPDARSRDAKSLRAAPRVPSTSGGRGRCKRGGRASSAGSGADFTGVRAAIADFGERLHAVSTCSVAGLALRWHFDCSGQVFAVVGCRSVAIDSALFVSEGHCLLLFGAALPHFAWLALTLSA